MSISRIARNGIAYTLTLYCSQDVYFDILDLWSQLQSCAEDLTDQLSIMVKAGVLTGKRHVTTGYPSRVACIRCELCLW